MASDNNKNCEGKLWEARGKSYFPYEIKAYNSKNCE